MQQARRYEIHELLGRGGMGEVYRGTALGAHGFAKPVAIKRLRRELARNKLFVQRLVQEAKLLVPLQHSNLVSVLDLGRTSADVFIALEYVDGPNLRTLLDAGLLPLEIGVFVVRAACEGVAFAHEQRQGAVVHADLSPSNVLLSRAGEVKVTDFGIARREGGTSRAGSVEGKWPYMSPEQLRGEALSTRSDVFSMGVLLYETAAGRLPFDGPGKEAIAEAILDHDPPDPRDLRPEIPEPLAFVCMRALAKQPEQRFTRIRELAAALEEVAFGQGWRGGSAELATWVAEKGPRPIRRTTSMRVVLSELGVGAADQRATKPAKMRGNAPAPEPPLLTGTVIARGPAEASGFTHWSLPTHRSAWLRVALAAAVVLVLGAGAAMVWRLASVAGAGHSARATARHGAVLDASRAGPDGAVSVTTAAQHLEMGRDASTTPADSRPSPTTRAVSKRRTGRRVRKVRRPGLAGKTAKQRARATAVLRIHAEPWGYVYIDGKNTGKATPSIHRLRSGEHRVRVYSPNTGLGRTMVVKLRGRETRTVSLRLEDR